MPFLPYLFFAIGLAHAAVFDPGATQVCTKFFACGHFEGRGGPAGQSPQFTEVLTAEATGDLTARLSVKVTFFDGPARPDVYDLEIEFADNGQFTASRGGVAYASGICKEGRCTYGMMPVTTKEGARMSNAGILRFSAGRLERFMYVLDDAATYEQYSDLKAK